MRQFHYFQNNFVKQLYGPKSDHYSGITPGLRIYKEKWIKEKKKRKKERWISTIFLLFGGTLDPYFVENRELHRNKFHLRLLPAQRNVSYSILSIASPATLTWYWIIFLRTFKLLKGELDIIFSVTYYWTTRSLIRIRINNRSLMQFMIRIEHTICEYWWQCWMNLTLFFQFNWEKKTATRD